MMTKQCVDCGAEAKAGRGGRCGKCYYRKWRAKFANWHSQFYADAANRARVLAQSKARYAAHRECVLKRQQMPGIREKNLERARKRYIANREKDLVRRRARYAVQRDAIRKRRADNHERILEAERIKRAKNPERYRAYGRKWRAANPETQRALISRYRARKANAPQNDFTAEQWIAMQVKHDYRCFYCGEQPKVLTQDHKVPLNRGGSHTESNILPACRPCNSRKHTMDFDVFISKCNPKGIEHA